MFQKVFDDIRQSIRASLRITSVAIAAAVTAILTVCFLCAAAFIFVLDRYGLIEACLAGAGFFLIVTLVLLAWYVSLQRRMSRPVEQAKSTFQSALADPMVLAAGLQLIRAVGVKRLVPLLAIAGLALGLMTTRTARQKDDGDKAPPLGGGGY
jgi:hypothetical protein